jgi:hypothetical protein
MFFGLQSSVQRAKLLSHWRFRRVQGDPVRTALAMSHVVQGAAAIFPGRVACLEQSLALFLLLNWLGINAQLRIGARVFPFAAHAWVEVHGCAVNTDASVLRELAPFQM